MWFVSKITLLKALSDLSINLASGWLGVVLIAPGFTNVSVSKYLELLTTNLVPAIIVFVIGLFLLERSKKI
jgi:hypothetical protein